jgi:hypothetical protein
LQDAQYHDSQEGDRKGHASVINKMMNIGTRYMNAVNFDDEEGKLRSVLTG